MLRRIVVMLILAAALWAADSQVEECFQAGIAAIKRNDLPGAQTKLEEAVRLDPKHVGAWLLLAQTFAKLQKPDSALEAARKAEALAGDDPDILQALANLYSGLIPDPVKAATLGARYAELRPQDQTAWRRLTAFCVQSGQTECAIQAGTRGLKDDNSAALHSLLGQAYEARKQWTQATAEFDEAVKLNPYDDDLRFRLAQVYLLQEEWPGAVRVLENARQYFDKSPQIELALGVAWYGQREFEKAVDQFLRTIRLAPDVVQPYLFLGRITEHAGDRLGEMEAAFTAYQERNPNQPLGYVLHAKAMIAQLPAGSDTRQAQPALELLQRALSLKEDDAEAHYLAGLVLERQGEFAKAAAHLERSIALNAGDPAPHYRLARVYAQLGRKQDAERERALHEKLSNEVTVGQPLGMPAAIPRVPGTGK
jgi:tetratricopeptide (TPR) repeat protein